MSYKTMVLQVSFLEYQIKLLHIQTYMQICSK